MGERCAKENVGRENEDGSGNREEGVSKGGKWEEGREGDRHCGETGRGKSIIFVSSLLTSRFIRFSSLDSKQEVNFALLQKVDYHETDLKTRFRERLRRTDIPQHSTDNGAADRHLFSNSQMVARRQRTSGTDNGAADRQCLTYLLQLTNGGGWTTADIFLQTHQWPSAW